MRTIIGLAIVLINVLGCAPQTTIVPTNENGERTVEEALLEYLIRGRNPPQGHTVCLGIRHLRQDSSERRDLTAVQFGRFQKLVGKVVPASECNLRDDTGPMIHTRTGEAAVMYVATLIQQSVNSAELTGARYSGSLDAVECRYTAQKHPTRGWIFNRTAEPCAVS